MQGKSRVDEGTFPEVTELPDVDTARGLCLVLRPPQMLRARCIERKSHEANVSAQSNPPRPHPRVPRENEYEGWSPGIGPQASEGTAPPRPEVQ